MTARFIVADVFDGLATLDDGSVDLVVTSPPFLALRSYLPADHPDKGKEIGSEPTPAAFIDVMLAVTAELRRVLAPHGSICVELGDTYAGSGGAGGDYGEGGWREFQDAYGGSGRLARYADERGNPDGMRDPTFSGANTLTGAGQGWPLAKSKALIPELYEIALAYGINPLTGQESPAGRWRVRNIVDWCRPNPPVGALGDKWRPATSDVVVACVSDKRYWDDIATRKRLPHHDEKPYRTAPESAYKPDLVHSGEDRRTGGVHPSGAPLLDYWEIPPGGYKGSHYAVFPPALVEPLVKAMAPRAVCTICGKPQQRTWTDLPGAGEEAIWTCCGCGDGCVVYDFPEPHGICEDNHWRPAHILDPFAGSGTTGVVATGHGHDVTLIDLDERNRELARERIGPFLFEQVDASSGP